MALDPVYNSLLVTTLLFTTVFSIPIVPPISSSLLLTSPIVGRPLHTHVSSLLVSAHMFDPRLMCLLLVSKAHTQSPLVPLLPIPISGV